VIPVAHSVSSQAEPRLAALLERLPSRLDVLGRDGGSEVPTVQALRHTAAPWLDAAGVAS